MAIEKNAFAYWEGVMPPYIEYCLKSMQTRIGKDINFILLTPGNIDTYLKDSGLHENWRKITNIAQKVDCLRIAVLNKYGGLYLDLDTVILKPLNHLFNSNFDMNVFRWTFNKRILNGYFLSNKKSKFLQHCLNNINNILETDPRPYYSEGGGVYLGECIFKEAEKVCEFITLDLKILLPIEFPPIRNCWYNTGNIINYITNETVAIALNHSQYPDHFRNISLQDHMRADYLFGDIFRYSESEHFGKLL